MGCQIAESQMLPTLQELPMEGSVSLYRYGRPHVSSVCEVGLALWLLTAC